MQPADRTPFLNWVKCGPPVAGLFLYFVYVLSINTKLLPVHHCPVPSGRSFLCILCCFGVKSETGSPPRLSGTTGRIPDNLPGWATPQMVFSTALYGILYQPAVLYYKNAAGHIACS